MVLRLNAVAFRAWTRLCAASLSAARAEIDALNVFPVPDGDTGNNAYHTFQAGAGAVDALAADVPLPELVTAYTHALLLSAKGNAGNICSQLVRACFRDLDLEGEIDATAVAHSFRAASDAADAAVGVPVEGTILTVARAAAVGAEKAAADGRDPRGAFAAAAEAARAALLLTPSQLPRLAEAGVVDAGGRALVVLLDATETALTGRVPTATSTHVPVPVLEGDDLVEGGPAYEVMYLLDAEDDKVPPLRRVLGNLGDSLVVVGGDRLWKIHVHVDDVGAAIEAALDAGRPYRIEVTHFADQIARQRRPRKRSRAVIAATTGAGVAEVCRDLGADVLEFSRSRPLTIDQVVAALRDTGADEVVVLPNAHRHIGLFQSAASQLRHEDVRVAVIPTHAQVQGLAALAVHDAGREFDEDVVAMSSTAAHAQHGAVTIATEPGITMAGPCQTGDVLGVVSGDFAVVGVDITAVAADVVDRLLTSSSELVTLVLGEGAPEGLADALSAGLRASRVDVDVEVIEGRQEHYPLFVAVE